MLAPAEISEERLFSRHSGSSFFDTIGTTAERQSGTETHAALHKSKELRKRLAEAILLQSIEDLWDPERREESLSFFSDGRFELCAEAAGISYLKQLKLLGIVAGAGSRKTLQ